MHRAVVWGFIASLIFTLSCSESTGGGGGSGGTTASGGSGGASGSLCETGCDATLAANCSSGPATQAQCVSDCESLSSGICATEYHALQACADGQAITCNAQG